MKRRHLFSLGTAFIAAPAIVRVSSLMALSPLKIKPALDYTQQLIQAMLETYMNHAASVLDREFAAQIERVRVEAGLL